MITIASGYADADLHVSVASRSDAGRSAPRAELVSPIRAG